CRRLWPLLTDKRSQQAVEVAERFADGEVGLRQLIAASAAAYRARDAQREGGRSPYTKGAYGAIETCRRDPPLRLEVALREAERAATHHAPPTRERRIWPNAQAEERANLVALLRDVFGPQPFRPLPSLSAAGLTWNDGLAVKLAQVAYDD